MKEQEDLKKLIQSREREILFLKKVLCVRKHLGRDHHLTPFFPCLKHIKYLEDEVDVQTREIQTLEAEQSTKDLEIATLKKKVNSTEKANTIAVEFNEEMQVYLYFFTISKRFV